MRLIDTIGADVSAPLLVAKVYRDASQDAYLVKFFPEGKRHRPQADYETDDKADAIGTAKSEVRRAYRTKGLSAQHVPVSARDDDALFASLLARGFDGSKRDPLRVRCNACEALVINGTPSHETGCPNAMHECNGCNALIPVRQRYCRDCAS